MEVAQILGICHILLEGLPLCLFLELPLNSQFALVSEKNIPHQIIFYTLAELASVLKHLPFHKWIKSENNVNKYTLLYIFTCEGKKEDILTYRV